MSDSDHRDEPLTSSDTATSSESFEPKSKPSATSEQSRSVAEPSSVAAPKVKASWAGRFALLLVLSLIAGLGASGWWLYPQWQARERALAQELETLRAQLAQIPPAESERALWQDAFGSTEASVSRLLESVQQDRRLLAQELTAMREADRAQREALRQFSAADQRIWQLAEARYMLRLAHQRLSLGGDVSVALTLLDSVDKSLQSLDDPRLTSVRSALAFDIEALSRVNVIDVEGTYFQISALLEQLSVASYTPAWIASQSAGSEMPDTLNQPTINDESVWGRLLAKFDNYLKVRPLQLEQDWVDPTQANMLLQNLQLLLTQSQIALIARDDRLYHASLEQISDWLDRYVIIDQDGQTHLRKRIAELQTLSLTRELPSIDRSIIALTDYMALEPETPARSNQDASS